MSGGGWQRGDQREEASACKQMGVRTMETVTEMGGRMGLGDFVLRIWLGSHQLKVDEETRR